MEQLFLGFYFGVMASVLLYNFQWYINTKEKSYLYYVLMHISLVFMYLHTSAILETSILITGVSALVLSLYFIKEFLNINFYYKHLDKFIVKFCIGFFLFFLLIYMTDNLAILAKIPFFLLFVPFLFIAYSVYKKGLDVAKYFLLAWGLYIMWLCFAYINKNFEIVEVSKNVIPQVGNLIETLILSFALSQKTKQLIKEKKEQEQMLIHQSRLASMGEMLANISHQWRQPLNRIASFIMNMQMHIMDHYQEDKYLPKKLEESQDQLEYMSNTIDDFTNFYKKDKQKEEFLVSAPIEDSCKIIESSLTSNNIELEITVIEDFKINSYKKELSQVLLNIMQNSKDALLLNRIANPKINIIIDKKIIYIQDNAKGIPEDIINNIFEPYFTTKEKHKGTGLGLYMSKIIIEKNMNAKLSVKNKNEGALFSIDFN